MPPQGGRKHPEQKMIAVDTKNILFVCGGAFEGIERHIAKRMNTQVVGYGTQKKQEEIDKDNLLQYIIPDDIRKFGLIPEIVGRLPVLTHLSPLDREALRITSYNVCYTKLLRFVWCEIISLEIIITDSITKSTTSPFLV